MLKYSKFVLVALAVGSMTALANADEVLVNGGFETGDFTGWNAAGGKSGGVTTTAQPSIGAQDGSFAIEISAGGAVGTVEQVFPASPGQEYNMSGWMLTENQLPQGDPPPPTFGLFKIVFRDANGSDLPLPQSMISVGQENPAFPGAESLPFLNGNSPVNEWIFSEAQAVAPAGTTQVLFIALNVDFAGGTNPMWFDNVQASLVTGGGTPGPNMLANGNFETGNIDGWTDPSVNPAGGPSIGSPPTGPQEGNFASEIELGGTVGEVNQSFPANPGDEYSLSGWMLSIFGVPESSFGLYKIVFRDADGNDLEPESLSVGQAAPAEFPGVESLPFLDNTTTGNIWTFSEAQGIAPVGTVEVIFFALNVDQGGGTNPIWYDDVQACLISAPSCMTSLGDIDQNGTVELLDIAPFVDLLNTQGFQCEADINEDGMVTLLDVAGFVAILSGG